MKIAGIDYGTVRVGIAVSDVSGKIAFPSQTYIRQSTTQDAKFFKRFVNEEQIEQIVVGLPLHLSGDVSEKADEVLQFGKWIGELTGLKIDYFDERYSSVEAEQILRQAKLTGKKRKEKRDMIAAQILLSAYLESGCVGISDYYNIDG
ncbi:MAG: Holliday junction resolvase RuvX [Planctomycetaceae bacterium]|jgi:putative Holliday junction resolvase|nr:Holliday junction resolvase RuvX [Planctomycetaceae bacterium]